MELAPESIAELQEFLLTTHGTLHVADPGPLDAWRNNDPPADVRVLRHRLGGIRDYDPADQVMTVAAGTRLAEVRQATAAAGQRIPHGGPFDADSGTVGDLVDLNLPHTGQSSGGTWRDWVLGLELVTAEGEHVRVGSRAVKSVAGYDGQRLLIGARGTLGIIVAVHLRTTPGAPALPENPVSLGPVGTVLTVRRANFATAREALTDRILAEDAEAGTLWLSGDAEVGEWPHAHCIGWGQGATNVTLDPVSRDWWQKTRVEVDPRARLNPGEFSL
jgi:glycolate oxidase FAD binding subunit